MPISLYIVDTLQEAIDLVDDYAADHTWQVPWLTQKVNG
jgi:hypothetical protein